jgi:hypothetical protein
MGIVTERQVVVTCDNCWSNAVEADVTQKHMIEQCRKAGWLISKDKTLCSDCRKTLSQGGK